MHGVPNFIAAQRHSLKLAWLCLILASLGACIFFVASSVHDYFSYPVITNTDVVYELPSQFPVVAVCNLNRFQTEEARSYVDALLPGNVTIDTTFGLAYLMANLVRANVSDAYRRSMSYEPEGSIVSCSYSDGSCSASDFEWY